MNEYLAVLFAVDVGGSGETFSCSVAVDTLDKETVIAKLMNEADFQNTECFDTVLVITNGEPVGTHPFVVKF